MFLRSELCSNKHKLQSIISRFAASDQWLNLHTDFPYCSGSPITGGAVRLSA